MRSSIHDLKQGVFDSPSLPAYLPRGHVLRVGGVELERGGRPSGRSLDRRRGALVAANRQKDTTERQESQMPSPDLDPIDPNMNTTGLHRNATESKEGWCPTYLVESCHRKSGQVMCATALRCRDCRRSKHSTGYPSILFNKNKTSRQQAKNGDTHRSNWRRSSRFCVPSRVS